MKTVRFASSLIPLIIFGEKTSTWRLWDDKNLSQGDEIELVDFETGKQFGMAEITSAIEKSMADLTDEDKAGHESFVNDQEMYSAFSGYYKREVTPQTKVKIVKFKLK